MPENSAIDAAIRLRDIPFVEFTTDLVTQVFDSLVQSHVLQMHEYANFVNTLSEGLSEYINNTIDNVSFQDVSNLITTYSLPSPDFSVVEGFLAKLKAPDTTKPAIQNPPANTEPSAETTWWSSLIKGLAPVVSKLVDKIKDPNLVLSINALTTYNDQILANSSNLANNIPTYKQIHNSIAALIASNKYALLQNMVNQGMMQLRVSRGRIETRLSFNTYTYSNNYQSSFNNTNDKQKSANNKFTGGGLINMLSGKRGFTRDVSRIITVTTESSGLSTNSGTNINIYGSLLLEFETK